MRFNSKAAREAKPAGSDKKKRRRRWLAPVLSLGLAPLVLLASPGTASAQTWCFQGGDDAHILTGSTTWAKGTNQASNTWQDWVWRGPTWQCPWNVPGCSYAYQESKTAGWEWSIGLSISVPIPYIDKVLSSITPSYGRSGSTTTAYTYTVQLRPGQFAQPISVVERRWQQGTYVGAFRTDGSLCDPRHLRVYRYWWDGDYEFGHWSTNVRVNDWGTYNVWY